MRWSKEKQQEEEKDHYSQPSTQAETDKMTEQRLNFLSGTKFSPLQSRNASPDKTVTGESKIHDVN